MLFTFCASQESERNRVFFRNININININHEYKIRPKVARTNYFKYSFSHRYINDWNSLPFKVMSSPSLQSFKVSPIKCLR